MTPEVKERLIAIYEDFRQCVIDSRLAMYFDSEVTHIVPEYTIRIGRREITEDWPLCGTRGLNFSAVSRDLQSRSICRRCAQTAHRLTQQVHQGEGVIVVRN